MLAGGILSGIMNIITGIFSYIPKTIYLIWVSAASILDLLQSLFRKVVGLDTFYVSNGATGSQQSGDIVMTFIKSIFGIDGQPTYSPLATAFWALLIVAIMLLIISTIIAMIRSEYTPEKDGNGKSKYIGRALKAFASFVIIPITCIFGIELANITLRALDYATQSASDADTIINYDKLVGVNLNGKRTYCNYDMFGISGTPSGYTTFSGTAFKVAAYNANRVRGGEYTATDQFSTFGIFENTQGDESMEDIAVKIDTAFANCYQVQNPEHLKMSDANWTFLIDVGDPWSLSLLSPLKYFSKFDVGKVWYYYNLWKFDFLTAFASIMIMCTIFSNVVFGMMKRTIELVGLFIISPPIIALMPLDGGAAFGNWKKNFLSKTLAAYGAVVGMNVFNLILPYLNTIKFFGLGWEFTLLNSIVQVLFVITGLMTVKSFVAIVSGLIGAEDSNKEGEGIAKEVGATVAKAGQAALKIGAAVATGGASAISGVGFAKMAAGSIRGAHQGHVEKREELDKAPIGNTPNKEEYAQKYANSHYRNTRRYRWTEKHKGKAAADAKAMDYENSFWGRRQQAKAAKIWEEEYKDVNAQANNVAQQPPTGTGEGQGAGSATPSANRDSTVENTKATPPTKKAARPNTWYKGLGRSLSDSTLGRAAHLADAFKAIGGLFGGSFIDSFNEGGGFKAYGQVLHGKDPKAEKAIKEAMDDIKNKQKAQENLDKANLEKEQLKNATDIKKLQRGVVKGFKSIKEEVKGLADKVTYKTPDDKK